MVAQRHHACPWRQQAEQTIVSFVTRQILDMFSPSNSPLTNPEILKATMEEGGQNLVRLDQFHGRYGNGGSQQTVGRR